MEALFTQDGVKTVVLAMQNWFYQVVFLILELEEINRHSLKKK